MLTLNTALKTAHRRLRVLAVAFGLAWAASLPAASTALAYPTDLSMLCHDFGDGTGVCVQTWADGGAIHHTLYTYDHDAYTAVYVN